MVRPVSASLCGRERRLALGPDGSPEPRGQKLHLGRQRTVGAAQARELLLRRKQGSLCRARRATRRRRGRRLLLPARLRRHPLVLARMQLAPQDVGFTLRAGQPGTRLFHFS
jgi:hypothetical protein